MRFPTYPPDILSRADALLSEKYPDGIVDPRFVEIACEAMMMEQWRDISTAPWGKWILCWWTPVNDNPWAETAAKVQIVAPPDLYADDARPLTYWDGYQEWPIERLTHWQPLPAPPSSPSPGTTE